MCITHMWRRCDLYTECACRPFTPSNFVYSYLCLYCVSSSSYPAGSVVMLLLNTNFTTATVELLNEELASSYRDVFWLSPPAGDLTSTLVLLNGVLLELVDNRNLPHLVPAEDYPGSSLSVPRISFGFVVFKDTKIPACT